MYLNLRLSIRMVVLLLLAGCSSPQVTKVLSPVEQIAVDSERAAGLANDFRKKVRFVRVPRLERFLSRMGTRLAGASRDFPLERVEVKIHYDSSPDLRRAFSFPGTLVSLPLGFLRQVDYENELAAGIAYELGHVINRHLANRIFSGGDQNPNQVAMFGDSSVFEWDRDERARSIKVGTELLYYAGYDVRGMASIFQRNHRFFGNPDTDSNQKEVEFNVREAQRSRSGLLPPVKPIVRSSEFIQFKRELGRVQGSE
ncbi:MAG: M48 family metalloprotease [Bdellovibrionales bacterium]|nr:M48 family metalloprotease [Bdellovibrionales bacterium]